MQTLLVRLDKLSGWQAAVVWGLVTTLALRLGLGLVMAAAWLTVEPHVSAVEARNPELYGELTVPAGFLAGALRVWPRWDAIHHLNLALRGYGDVSPGDSVFYPLYAMTVRTASTVIGGDVLLAGLLVTTVAAWAAFALLYQLADGFYGRQTAQWSLAALATFPTAVFLVAPFTEALFLALTLGAFLAAYKQRWWLAGMLGGLASLTRGPGMLTALALAVIAWQQWRQHPSERRVRWATGVAAGLGLPVAAGLGFLAWRQAAGFPSMTETLRVYSGLVLTDPLSGLVRAVWQWLQVHDLPTTLDLLSAMLFLGLTVAAAVQRPRRPEWAVFMAAHLGFFLTKQSEVASSLQSLPRYVLTLFPGFILLGGWLARQRPPVRFAYLTASSTALMVLAVLYALWVFVG